MSTACELSCYGPVRSFVRFSPHRTQCRSFLSATLVNICAFSWGALIMDIMNASSKSRTRHFKLNSRLLPEPAVTAATEANDAPRYPRPLVSKAYRVLLSVVSLLLASQLFRLILGPGEGRFTDASRNAPPVHAANALHKCSLLEVESGPPADFASRKRSDRAVPGTKATLITVSVLRVSIPMTAINVYLRGYHRTLRYGPDATKGARSSRATSSSIRG